MGAKYKQYNKNLKTSELNLGLRGAGGKNIANYPNHPVCYEAQNRTVSTEE